MTGSLLILRSRYERPPLTRMTNKNGRYLRHESFEDNDCWAFPRALRWGQKTVKTLWPIWNLPSFLSSPRLAANDSYQGLHIDVTHLGWLKQTKVELSLDEPIGLKSTRDKKNFQDLFRWSRETRCEENRYSVDPVRQKALPLFFGFRQMWMDLTEKVPQVQVDDLVTVFVGCRVQRRLRCRRVRGWSGRIKSAAITGPQTCSCHVISLSLSVFCFASVWSNSSMRKGPK